MAMGTGEALWIAGCVATAVGISVFGYWQKARTKAKERAEREQRDKDEAEFRTRAKRVRARIRSSYQMGMVNQMPNFKFHLRVEAPEGPYDVWVEKHLGYMAIPRYVDGSVVEVRVDPNNRERVVIDGPVDED